GYVYFLSFETGTLPYWFYMFFTVIAGISVPIFFMISGMLLLGKNESIGYIWKRRIPKYVIILAVFSLIFYILDTIICQREFSIKQFLISIYSEGAIIPYWFLYVYISFLILLPFIRKMARDITEKEFIYLLAVYFVFVTVVEILQYMVFKGTVTLIPSLNPAALCNLVIFYPVIGYYLGARLKRVTNKMLLVSFGLFVISVISTMLITNYKLELTGEFTEENANTFINSARPFQVIFIFLSVRKLFENRKYPIMAEKFIAFIGGCVFGIYLIEHAYREGLYSIYDSLCTKIGSFTAIWIYVFIIFAICLIQVAAFKYVIGIFRKNISKHM
ncbi:MAG: acyltransferase, partial [Lachnospiraceae bacterium]|nr:acyltransferase [Lachnospiraceae bacterium]